MDDIEKLKEFARQIISSCCWGYAEVDGGDVQEIAEKLGLIERHVATEEDVDPEVSDFEVGDIIYKFADILKEVRKDNGTDSPTES